MPRCNATARNGESMSFSLISSKACFKHTKEVDNNSTATTRPFKADSSSSFSSEVITFFFSSFDKPVSLSKFSESEDESSYSSSPSLSSLFIIFPPLIPPFFFNFFAANFSANIIENAPTPQSASKHLNVACASSKAPTCESAFALRKSRKARDQSIESESCFNSLFNIVRYPNVKREKVSMVNSPFSARSLFCKTVSGSSAGES